MVRALAGSKLHALDLTCACTVPNFSVRDGWRTRQIGRRLRVSFHTQSMIPPPTSPYLLQKNRPLCWLQQWQSYAEMTILPWYSPQDPTVTACSVSRIIFQSHSWPFPVSLPEKLSPIAAVQHSLQPHSKRCVVCRTQFLTTLLTSCRHQSITWHTSSVNSVDGRRRPQCWMTPTTATTCALVLFRSNTSHRARGHIMLVVRLGQQWFYVGFCSRHCNL